MFNFGGDADSVTEEQWIDYFREALESKVRNYVVVDDDMKALRMDTKLSETAPRMNRLQDDFFKILEVHNLDEEMFAEVPRRIFSYMVEAIEPVGFRDVVKHQLTMESNRDMKKIIPF